MNGLSTLQEGSTTGDAELIGIRTGYDSTNYSSAGEAVRTQISNVIDFINNKSLLKKTLDNSITDLNDISEPGIYFISSSQVVSIANTANQTDGFILIDYNDNNSATRHYQIVITYTAQILYLRNNKNGIWSAWRRIIDENTFNVLVNPITSNISRCFKQVSDVTDCNDAPTGYIYFPSSSGISNLPTNGGGVLFTNIGTSNNIFQFYMDGTGKIYNRTKINGTWNDWKNYVDSENTFRPVEIDQNMDIDDLISFNAYYIPSRYVTNKLPSNDGGLLFNYIYPTNITTRHYQMFMAYFNNKIYIRNKNNGVFTDWKELLSASAIQQNASTTTSNLIKKDSETQYTIYFGDFNIKLVRVDNDTTNSHLWNIYDIRKELDILVPIGTDIVGPIKEVGEADFMGGLHGDETTTMFEVYCDGCIYDMNSLTTFNTLDILMKSDLYRVSSKEKIAERIVHISISNNKIHIHSQIKATVGFNVERCTNGGLIAARNNIITGLFINNYIANEVQNTSINGIASKDNTTAIIFTTLGTIKVQNIIGHERNTYKGNIHVFTSENPMRTKIYFDTISGGSISIQANETITGEFEYTFNK